ncbi:MAG: S9 family peptidase, partial [Porticoccaceae bacterium]|nr:S9 family peptidase [Porticoccaceae bacterium]
YLKTLDNAPVRLVLYPGEGHGNRKVGAKYDYSLRLLRWMEHYLTGPGGTPPEQDLKHGEKLGESDDQQGNHAPGGTPSVGELVMDNC